MGIVLVGLAMVTLALGVPGITMAADEDASTLFAIKNLQAPDGTSVTPMDDAVLASVEGRNHFLLDNLLPFEGIAAAVQNIVISLIGTATGVGNAPLGATVTQSAEGSSGPRSAGQGSQQPLLMARAVLA